MVLGDLSLWKLLNDLIRDPDPDLVNPASIDVRVGHEMLLEVAPGDWKSVDLTAGPVHLQPGEFAQVSTLEWLMVPNGYVVEVTLKGSYAGQGYAHSVGVWLEPGWCGPAIIGIRNATRYTPLPMEQGMRIAEIVIHELDQPTLRPDRGQRRGTVGRPKAAPATDVSAR
jgi:deoxycytidine triphosphate deaminase